MREDSEYPGRAICGCTVVRTLLDHDAKGVREGVPSVTAVTTEIFIPE